jgi:acetylornithine deacetylase
VQRLAEEVAQKNPGCIIDARILRADAGFARPAVSHLGASLSAMLGREQTGISFGSEATRFSSIVEEAVVIGPGDMETAHSERECIPQTELDEWTRTVKHLLLGKAACTV